MSDMFRYSAEAMLGLQQHFLRGMGVLAAEREPTDTAAAPPVDIKSVSPPADAAAVDALGREAVDLRTALVDAWAEADERYRNLRGTLSEAGAASDAIDAIAPERIPGLAVGLPEAVLDGLEDLARRGGPHDRAPPFGVDLPVADGPVAAVRVALSELAHARRVEELALVRAWIAAVDASTPELPAEPSVAGTEAWTRDVRRRLDETCGSPDHRATRAGSVRAAARLEDAQRDVGAFLSRVYGLPSRAEFDALGREMASAKREIRRLKRALRDAALPLT